MCCIWLLRGEGSLVLDVLLRVFWVFWRCFPTQSSLIPREREAALWRLSQSTQHLVQLYRPPALCHYSSSNIPGLSASLRRQHWPSAKWISLSCRSSQPGKCFAQGHCGQGRDTKGLAGVPAAANTESASALSFGRGCCWQGLGGHCCGCS